MTERAGRRDERPHYATTDAGWLRQLSRVLVLLMVVMLVAVLFRAGRDVLAEGERMALQMAEQNLENLVWLEAKRVVNEEGVEVLRRRAVQDPRVWARDRLSSLPMAERPGDALPAWAEDRWSFDDTRGELVYRPSWIEGGERRWRVELIEDGADSLTPGLARDLLLVRVSPDASSNP